MHAKSHPNVMVECEDGDTYYADHVICTIPLGIYKINLKTVPYPRITQELDRKAFEIFLKFETSKDIKK